MQIFSSIQSALEKVGLGASVQISENRLSAATAIMKLSALHEADSLRFECKLVDHITPNKVSLWNVIHQNNTFLPFGQFYISPENNIAFGFRMSYMSTMIHWIERVVYETCGLAEAYCKMIREDFNMLPFHERQCQTEVLDLFKTRFSAPLTQPIMNKTTAFAMLGQLLAQLLPDSGIICTDNFEYAIAGDNITTVTIETLPTSRRLQNLHGWAIGVRTEVGQLEHTDNSLWVKINRLNYDQFMLALSVKYQNRKPTLVLTTELLADFIQHPAIIQHTLNQHNAQTRELLTVLRKPYRIQNLVQAHFGI